MRDAKRRIYEYLKIGVHVSSKEISEKLDIPWSTVKGLITILKQEKLIYIVSFEVEEDRLGRERPIAIYAIGNKKDKVFKSSGRNNADNCRAYRERKKLKCIAQAHIESSQTSLMEQGVQVHLLAQNQPVASVKPRIVRFF